MMEFTRRLQFGAFLTHHELMGKGVEVGVMRGAFSQRILDSWEGECLYLVDAWQVLDGWMYVKKVTQQHFDCWYRDTIKAVEKHKSRVKILRMLSVEAAKEIADNSLDFVVIDADHRYESVVADIAAWWPKLRVGGLFTGHDYMDAEPTPKHPIRYGVKQAVDEFAASIHATVNATAEDFPTWWFFKEASP